MTERIYVRQKMNGDWGVYSGFNDAHLGSRRTRDKAVAFARDYAHHQDVRWVDVRLPPKCGCDD